MSSPQVTDRDALTSRILPEIVLSTGSPTSHTPAPTTLLSDTTSPTERARLRFQVSGNAIITGGTGTLALSTASALLSHGLQNLMLLDISPQTSPELTSLRLSFPDAQILTLAVDITSAPAVQEAISQTTTLIGSIHHLLCFAGVVDCTPALSMSPAAFRRTIDINTTGSFLCAQAFAQQFISQSESQDPTTQQASITFIASISAHRVNFPQPQVAYNVSKAAILTLKNCLAAEWARYGIRVNSVSPGYMDTILNAGDGIASTRGVWAERNPMGRMGQPDELTGAVVLLCSAAGSYINGTDIVVDGGQIVF